MCKMSRGSVRARRGRKAMMSATGMSGEVATTTVTGSTARAQQPHVTQVGGQAPSSLPGLSARRPALDRVPAVLPPCAPAVLEPSGRAWSRALAAVHPAALFRFDGWSATRTAALGPCPGPAARRRRQVSRWIAVLQPARFGSPTRNIRGPTTRGTRGRRLEQAGAEDTEEKGPLRLE